MTAEWTYGAVAFIDVLGFSNFVASDAASLTPQHLDRLRGALQEVRSESANLDIRAFSDSIVIASELSSTQVVHLMRSVIKLQRKFIRSGVLIRGAVAFGKHFADVDFVYSEALIRAYTEERDEARFPRVLVNSDLLDWLEHDPATTQEVKQTIRPLLLADRDNKTFLNYLTVDDLQCHLDLLHSYSAADATPSVLEKIQWLAEYHNYIAIKSDSELPFKGPLLNGFREHHATP